MTRYKHARDIAELNFYEDPVLFKDETPQDIIGFCIGLTGTIKDAPKNRYLKITTRRVGINQEYTDIRREVGNLLLRLWDYGSMDLNDFWVNMPRKMAEVNDAQRRAQIARLKNGLNSPQRDIKEETIVTDISTDKFNPKHDGVLIENIVKTYNPALYKEAFGRADKKTKTSKKQSLVSINSAAPLFVNGVEKHDPPLLDIVRPTLLIYTMDTSFLRFVDECVIPKAPSIRLDPYNRNLRSWFNNRVLGWYSHFDADTHKDGGEFWYDLVVESTVPQQFKSFAKLNLNNIVLADPGDGMGGGERFP